MNCHLFICLLIILNTSLFLQPVFGYPNAQNSQNSTQISASMWHSFVLESGSLTAFGYNQDYELGNGLTENSNIPVFVDTQNVIADSLGNKLISQVSSGPTHSLLVSDGLVYAWGRNDQGQLGTGDLIDRSTPVLISTESSLLSGRKIIQVAAGYGHSLALDNKGFIYSWGSNQFGQLGDGFNETRLTPGFVDTTRQLRNKKIVQIAAGYYHNLAIDADSFLYAFGKNDQGQLGDSTYVHKNTPVFVYTEGILKAKIISQISAGSAHSMVLFEDGLVAAFGANQFEDTLSGQLGDGTFENKNVPVLVNFNVSSNPHLFKTNTLNGYVKIATISAGAYHSLAADFEGTVYSWGWNKLHQLGSPAVLESSNLPQMVFSAEVIYQKKITAVAAGYDHSLIMDEQGMIYAFGQNHFGQLGDNAFEHFQTKPVKVYCRPGFSGANCEIPICFGIPSNSDSVCNGHGKCVSPNNCICSNGYLPFADFKNCSIPICFGIPANETDKVCSGGNGDCTAPDTCICRKSSKKTGKVCEKDADSDYPFFFGALGTEVIVILLVLLGGLIILCVLNLAVLVSILIIVIAVSVLFVKKYGLFRRRSGKQYLYV